LAAFFSPFDQELEDIIEKWKTDDRTHHGTNHTGCPRKICRESEEIHRLDLDQLG